MVKFKKKNLSGSSKRWIQRQHHDKLVIDAKKLGYRSRAFFKLQEIDEKYHIVKSHLKVLDLGSAPGSWSQYLLKKKVKNILAIDLLKMEPLKGVVFLQGDFCEPSIQEEIKKNFKNGTDLILSDIAVNTSGSKNLDSYKTNTVCLNVLEFSKLILSGKGKVLCKFFNGELDKELIAYAKTYFNKYKIIKPTSSRKDSKEMYIFCQN